MSIVDGSSPDLTFYYNKTEINTETLASSASWTQYLEQTNLYSDPALTHQIGYKLQNSTNGVDMYQYQGTLTFGNEFGSITFVGGDENTTRDPNVGQIYLDRISGGNKDFLLANGVIATIYPLEGDVVAMYVYIIKEEVVVAEVEAAEPNVESATPAVESATPAVESVPTLDATPDMIQLIPQD